MIAVTERAATELQELLAANHASPEQGAKLVPDGKGGIGVTIDEPSEGDQVIRSGEAALLIVDGSIAGLLNEAEVDCETSEGNNGRRPGIYFTLRPAR